MAKHRIKQFTTQATIKGKLRTLYMFSCYKCEVYGKAFLKPEARKAFHTEHVS